MFKIILKPFLSLFSSRMLKLIIPIITYPIIISKIGFENYGYVLLALSTISIFSPFLNMGHDLVGVSDYQNALTEERKINVVRQVYSQKILILIVLSIIIILTSLFGLFKLNSLYFYSCWILIDQGFIPRWLMKAKNNFNQILVYELTNRFFFLFVIILFLKNEEDFIYIPMFNFYFTLAASIYFFLKENKLSSFKISLSIPSFNFNIMFGYFFDQGAYYIFKTIIGITLSATSLALYDLADKLFNVIKSPISILCEIFLSTYKSIAAKINSFLYLIWFFVIISILIFLLANLLVSTFYDLFFEENKEVVLGIFRILLIGLPFYAISILIRNVFIVKKRSNKYFNMVHIRNFVITSFCGLFSVFLVKSINYLNVDLVFPALYTFGSILIFTILIYENKESIIRGEL